METNLESLLRSADPARDITFSSNGAEVLANILSDDSKKQESEPTVKVVPLSSVRSQRKLLSPRVVWGVAAAFVVGVLAVGLTWFNTPQATAGLVPALITTPTGQDREEALDALLAKARETKDPTGFDEQAYQMKNLRESSLPKRVASIEETEAFSPVSEYEYVSVRRPDGLHQRYTTSLGIVSARTGERIPDQDVETGKRIPLGTTTKTIELTDTELAELKKTEPVWERPQIPDIAKDLDAQVRSTSENGLAMYSGNPDTALFEVLGFHLQDWNPSQAQSAAVLQLLQGRTDITFDGETTDRMGRAGLVFSIDQNYVPGYDPNNVDALRYSFIFDTATGHLNAFEEVAVDVDGFVQGGTRNSVTVAPL
ncbi:hypothetical protein QMQ05_04075 [Glutamicibacter ectropisis]|uniref:Uncharacterized protein n=1 Tax=Glutamicibacter ectropisis TaxID=3046593 RepID=A0AAU6WGQ1_9MICC